MWMHSPASRLKFAASFEQELPSSLTVATIIILRLILATNVNIFFLHFCSNSRFNCSDVNSFVILYL